MWGTHVHQKKFVCFNGGNGKKEFCDNNPQKATMGTKKRKKKGLNGLKRK